ncbi:unnamed protein product [Ceratitis capitata]|uniref:(Mediterranean fruit fly) hypothetical protein n=1 Tax=Ceratitis capitata TaxID=7213 RepID=A0A811V099_CERCA|nr:unnamed protein product [Ceratitis capitata]
MYVLDTFHIKKMGMGLGICMCVLWQQQQQRQLVENFKNRKSYQIVYTDTHTHTQSTYIRTYICVQKNPYTHTHMRPKKTCIQKLTKMMRVKGDDENALIESRK